MSRLRAFFGVALCACVLVFASTHADAASSRIAFLGLQAPSGNDALSREFTSLLRMHAKDMQNWQYRDVNVSLEQMMLANDCNTPDYLCLERIANSLKVDLIVYGSVGVEGSSSRKQDLRIALYVYEAGQSRLKTYVVDKIPDKHTTKGWLNRAAERFVQRLAGTATSLSNDPDAP